MTFRIKIEPKTIKLDHAKADNFKWEMPQRWYDTHTEVGFSPLQPGDIVELRSDGGQYYVTHKAIFEQGERVFIRLISNDPNELGMDYIPRGDRFNRVGAGTLV